MGPAVRRRSPDQSRSPSRNYSSLRRSSPSSRDRKSSPERKSYTKKYNRSPIRERSRSPAQEKVEGARNPRKGSLNRQNLRSDSNIAHHVRSPKRGRSRSPVKGRSPHLSRSPRARRPQKDVQPSPRNDSSGSPSPRARRVKQGQADREASRAFNGEDKRKNKDSGEDRIILNEKRMLKHRSGSPEEADQRRKNRSKSPSRASKPARHDEAMRVREPEEHMDDDDSIARMKAAEETLAEKQKQKPSFELSGKLAEETNRVRGVALLFTEPADARKPDVRWRLYVFKGGEVLSDPLYVHRQSCYLFGRERRVADIPTDHPSCSKQHAVLQYRIVETERADGLLSKKIRPYLMDLGSTNGTFINDDRIEPQRYYELREKDVIKFGNSSREYVMLHENSVK